MQHENYESFQLSYEGSGWVVCYCVSVLNTSLCFSLLKTPSKMHHLEILIYITWDGVVVRKKECSFLSPL